jgi:hypothetical protein
MEKNHKNLGKTFVAELHIHSTHSDGKHSVKKILEITVQKGIDVVSITDHDTINGSLEAMEIVEEEDMPLLILPGIEISSSEGHLLAYGITEDVEPGMSIKESSKAVRQLGGLCFLAHPFDFLRNGSLSPRSFLLVDGVEIFNAKNPFNFLARRFAKKYSKPGIAGSDAHSIKTIGYALNYLSVESQSGFNGFENNLVKSLLHAKIDGRMIPVIRRILEMYV